MLPGGQNENTNVNNTVNSTVVDNELCGIVFLAKNSFT